MTHILGRALDNGVRPSEASALLAHLAIYCGWPSAVSALDVYEQVYTARKVDAAALRETCRPRLVWRVPPGHVVVEGLNNAEIGRRLGISTRRVETHKANAMRKPRTSSPRSDFETRHKQESTRLRLDARGEPRRERMT
jgi:Bacterial regulatory proteins, luxR family/Carboxymuconolactone decarboxylase family